ncbi:hypothetical protein [Falsiroseomonas selenitidurans]|uniref:Uncharacterized protein n=1 Tax=Falsiroseomonas selenitidurans TaxID=2716335 RepID=A0ABX1E1T5_9PROT|nr:hypothetical protein [Falsiroseomonas selenitidurans]NKC29783.1 hypothetical protein [Falsiroseomonas selenitidurans]
MDRPDLARSELARLGADLVVNPRLCARLAAALAPDAPPGVAAGLFRAAGYAIDPASLGARPEAEAGSDGAAGD